MSAPKTNLDRQVSRHRGPLFGMMAVGGFVAVLLLGWLFYEMRGAPEATEAAPEGAVEPAPGTAPAPTGTTTGTTAPGTTAPPSPSQP